MKKDRPDQLTPPWQTFAILMAAVFIAEAFVMYLIHPFENRFSHLFISTLDATLLIALIAPVLWWFIVTPLRKKAMYERARAENVLATVPEGIVVADKEDKVLSLNPEAENLFGYKEEQLLGKPLTLLIPQWQTDRLIGETAELHGLTKHGREFPLELSFSSWRDQEKTFCTVVIRDISERKGIEQERQRVHDRQQALREINQAITSTLELKSVLGLLLEKMDLILPYAAGGVRLLDPTTGTLSYRALRNIDEEGLAKALEQSRSGLSELVLERKGPVTIHNIQIETRSAVSKFLASRGFVSYLGLPLVAKEKTVGVLSVLTKEEHTFSEEEIEFLKTLAGLAAMAIYNSQLYEETKRLAIELNKAKELEADFAAMIAHDLRSPLTSVLSTAAMLEDGLLGPVSEEQQKWLVKIQTMCHSLVDLVNDFLDLSKLEAGHVHLDKEKIDLNQLLRNNVETYLPLASHKGIALVEQIEPNLSPVEADPRRLDQVLHNLISNAIKFTPEGGKIEVGAGRDEGTEVKLWVKDTGTGIPPEELASLFQKYRQTTSGQTSKDKGTGLGLVICKMIVEAHGGTIEVDSTPGKGSKFTVWLPLNRQ